MSESERKRLKRRAQRRVALLVLAALAVGFGPSLVDSTEAGVERHFVAEVRADTAQDVAVQVGRELRDDPDSARLRVVPSPTGHGCVVEPFEEIWASCGVKIEVVSLRPAVRVTVTHRRESFTWDSSTVRL